MHALGVYYRRPPLKFNIHSHTHRLQITDYWGHAKIRNLHQIYLSINLNPASFWQVNNLNMACQPFLCVLTYDLRPQWHENNPVNDLTGQNWGRFHRKPAGNILKSPFRGPPLRLLISLKYLRLQDTTFFWGTC